MADSRSEAPDDDDDSPLQSLVAGLVTMLTLTVAFGLMAADVSFFWVAFVVGFGGLMPTAIGLVRWYEARSERDAAVQDSQSEQERALVELRERYARGELDDEEFESRVERLLETESVADARTYVERQDAPDAAEREESRT
jgi:uncharacterized membrane protein